MRYYVLTKVGMLFMKNSLKTSFESDDAEKLDGRKKEAGSAEVGGGHLPSKILAYQLTLFQLGLADCAHLDPLILAPPGF